LHAPTPGTLRSDEAPIRGAFTKIAEDRVMQARSLIVVVLTGLATMFGGAVSASSSVADRTASLEAAQPSTPTIRNFAFIAHQATGFRQFAPRRAPIFEAGEALQFYAEPVNLGWTQAGRLFKFAMHVDIEIRSPEGNVLWGQRDYGRLQLESQVADTKTYITGAVTVEGLPPGLYVMTIRFRDPQNNRSAESDVAFAIKAEPRSIDA